MIRSRPVARVPRRSSAGGNDTRASGPETVRAAGNGSASRFRASLRRLQSGRGQFPGCRSHPCPALPPRLMELFGAAHHSGGFPRGWPRHGIGNSHCLQAGGGQCETAGAMKPNRRPPARTGETGKTLIGGSPCAKDGFPEAGSAGQVLRVTGFHFLAHQPPVAALETRQRLLPGPDATPGKAAQSAAEAVSARPKDERSHRKIPALSPKASAVRRRSRYGGASGRGRVCFRERCVQIAPHDRVEQLIQNFISVGAFPSIMYASNPRAIFSFCPTGSGVSCCTHFWSFSHSALIRSLATSATPDSTKCRIVSAA